MTAAQKHLNRLGNYKEGLMTRLQWLKLQKSKGKIVEISTKNRLDWNRVKYNRMTSEKEQAEYMAKCDEKVPCYVLKSPNETSFYYITKTEYEAFLNS